MNQTCLVCKTKGTPAKTQIKDVFSDLNTLPSGRPLMDTLQEILDKSLIESEVHSKILCRKCYKSCVDYDGLKSRMDVIKLKMCDEYGTILQEVHVSKPNDLKEEKSMSTIVVPASKLLPVPPDFQLNFGQISGFGQVAISRPSATTKNTPLINLKVTIGSSVFTQSLKTSTVKIGKPVDSADPISVMSTKSDNISEWTTNALPKDIFSTMTEDGSQNYVDENDDDEERGDENEMEIDEDCPLPVGPVSKNQELKFDLENIKTESSHQSEDSNQFINVNVLPSVDGSGSRVVTADGNFVLSNLKIYNENDENGDEQHTIVVDGENGSILEMMSGQKFIYENGEISLVMQDDGDAENVHDDDDDDGQESNEESQIELQVSGDEETANAIIAAAQEQGGAFIKVESGEMYRVKSVHSRNRDSFDISTFVQREGNKFRCVLCQKLEENDTIILGDLLDASTMMRHLKTEHDAKLYICQLCGDGMRKRQDYTKHIAEHSAGAGRGRPAACRACGQRCPSRSLLREHERAHEREREHEHERQHAPARPHRCQLCHKGFASKYTYQAHVKTHLNRPRPYKCKQCGKCFLSKQNLSQHERTHSGIKNFKCTVCDKAFGTQHNLEVHGVVHSGARPFACHTCARAFARRAELLDHLRTHTGERPFECETCGARFAQRSNLHSHRRATHLDDKRHQCTDCPKRFKRRRLLEYHMRAAHTGERPLECEVCHATFVYPEHYKKHVRIHSGERPYFCEICGKSFNSRDNRNTHRFTHSDKKPYECLACGQSYMRKRLLIAHMNASGHLAESIVVNQPRVTSVNSEHGVATLVQLKDQNESPSRDDKSESVFHTSGKLELLEDTSHVNVPSDAPAKLYINDDNLETITVNEEGELIEAVNSTQIDTQLTQLGTDENGAVLRLIQVKLPDGNDGWVALND